MSALALDLGGTNLRAGLVGGAATEPKPLGHWQAPRSLDAFRNRIAALLSEHGTSEVGIAIPGLASGSMCLWVPNLPFLDGVDLTQLFPGVRVTLGNDAHFSLLAEAADGAARDCRNAILLAIGTGIGSAVLADGRILKGEGGAAISFGWACADPHDSGDDAHGWLERSASGHAMDRLAASLSLPDAMTLVSRARAGDERARAVLEPPMCALGAALAGGVALTGSPCVILAGGVADSLDVLGPMIRPALLRQLPPHLRSVRLAAGKFGSRSALVGAGLAARGHPIWLEDGS
ncbi:ROK family protein [Mesorhizobium xinjiangense]|uniref:ROK family protein n=1 Tax=Mesorhizobium xinjiangense TaxID=2678685 RepID=UPI0012EED19A|nr:ROK family protein [Mesorhizobium xinjiangense]